MYSYFFQTKNKPIIWPLENKLKSKTNKGFDELFINTLDIIKPKFELFISIYLLVLCTVCQLDRL